MVYRFIYCFVMVSHPFPHHLTAFYSWIILLNPGKNGKNIHDVQSRDSPSGYYWLVQARYPEIAQQSKTGRDRLPTSIWRFRIRPMAYQIRFV